MNNKIYKNENEITDKLMELYNRELVKKNNFISAANIDDQVYQNLQIKLLQTTQEFARSFDYDLGNATSIKRKFILFIKRVIRKLSRFITKPYADQMLKFQESTGELLGQMVSVIFQLNNGINNQSENSKNEKTELIELQQIIEKMNDYIIRQEDRIRVQEDNIKVLEDNIKVQEDNIKVQRDNINEQEDRLQDQEIKTLEQENKIVALLDKMNDIEMYKELTTNQADTIHRLDQKLVDTTNHIQKISEFVYKGDDSAYRSYSQTGEDSIISFMLKYISDVKKGFTYLDIGCNHYKNLSNTYHFYEKGYRGVLIDANPIFIDDIKKYRPEDTVLNVGIGSEKSDELTFYVVNGDGLSSFNKQVIEEAITRTSWLKIEKEIKVPVITIDDVIERYFYYTPTMVSIDIEGNELPILQNMDMEKYRPLIFIVETIMYRPVLDLDNKRHDIVEFMESKDYVEYAFTGVNSIFIDKRAIK